MTMPIRRRQPLGRKHNMTETEWSLLTDQPIPEGTEAAWEAFSLGHGWGLSNPDSPIFQVWSEAKTAALDWYIARFPGQRPRVWWTADAPEPRRCLTPNLPPFRGRWPNDFAYGLPTPLFLRNARPVLFESEAAYLRRLGLLAEGEAQKLTEADFEPEIVDLDLGDVALVPAGR